MDLFEQAGDELRRKMAPLPERMRPRALDEVLGQDEALGRDTVLRRMIESGRLPSLILWGPPGSGKTSIARAVARATGQHLHAVSAVTSGVKELREAVARARETLGYSGARTILFVDEIHRFNKAQQDALLPHVEDGTLTLIGATTENPSFEVISPLLSRTRLVVLKPLSEEDVRRLLRSALADAERGLGGRSIEANDDALARIAALAAGDGRAALNILEACAFAAEDDARRLAALSERTGAPAAAAPRIGVETVAQSAMRRGQLHDRAGEEHYNLASALQKSLRGSDADAALYWLARMLEAGEDPLFVARRVLVTASEDVGNADPRALQVALSAMLAVERLGMPEGRLALAQAVTYLALAPKSNAATMGYEAAARDALERPSDPVPLHLRNAPTGLMRDLGYGEGYVYPHDLPNAIAGQTYLPEGLEGRRYYRPTDRGTERALGQRQEEIDRLRAAARRRASGGGSGIAPGSAGAEPERPSRERPDAPRPPGVPDS